jgi:phage repressor protein C with HTH and peptisase S24 domain
MIEAHRRLIAAREAAGFKTATDAARALKVPAPTYLAHENGSRGLTAANVLNYAQQLNVDATWLLYGTGRGPGGADPWEEAVKASAGEDAKRHEPNATIGDAVRASRTKIPLYGQSAAGLANDGRFILNGQKITDILAPPILDGVRGGYAVYVHGDSMEPRYYAGEVLYVDPNRPVRRGDFVVVQVRDHEGDVPLGFVKRFGRRAGDELIVEQFNPPEGGSAEIRFDAEDVISIHKVVAAGEG